MDKLLAQLVTDTTSLEAVTKILDAHGYRRIVIPESIWDSIFMMGHKYYTVRRSDNINGIDVHWVNEND